MNHLLKIVLLAIWCIGAYASPTKTITFDGQNEDSFSLDTINTITRYKEEERDTTCTRQIPYQTEECGNETRYRQECRWQPGRNVCRTEYDTRCRTVTRYRQECRTEPGRQVCRNAPPRQICRNGTCRTEPGRRICDNKPGRRVCRQVPYQDRQCDRVPRQVCRNEPGRNVCSQVPYQEWVCRTVTRYRDETYACRRTVRIPYSFDRKIEGEVNVSYKDISNDALVELIFNLKENGNITANAVDKSNKPLLISLKKDVQQDVQDDFTKSNGVFHLNFYDKETELAPIKENIHSVGLSRTGAWLSIGKVSKPERLQVYMKIVRDGLFSGPKTKFEKTLNSNEFNLVSNGTSTKVQIDLTKYGVELDDKKHDVVIEVSLKFEDEIINLTREQFKRKQDFEIKVN